MRLATRQALRSMRLEDIPQVLEIERESFPTMWPPTAYKRELEENRLAHYLVTVQRNAEPPAADKAEAREHHGPIGRLFGEIKHILGTDDG
jgi:ribosomal-protein-alanine N-acetyltransferase